MKCNQSGPGFELVSPCPYPATITITPLHEDGQGYKKIANILKLSCSTVAKIIRCFKRAGSTQNKARVGRPKKLSARAERHIQMLFLKDRRRSAVSIAAEIEEVRSQPVSAQTIRRTLHEIGVHVFHPRRKLLLKMIHKKARKQFAEDMSTKHMDYGLMRWRLIWLVPMASSMCGGDPVRSIKISVSCLQSSIGVGMSWSRAAWELQVFESYISLRETWTPTCTVKYCSRAGSPPSRNWVARQCSSMIMAPNTPPRRPSISRLEPNRTSLGDPQAEVGGAQSL